jgi:hypothetical protein
MNILSNDRSRWAQTLAATILVIGFAALPLGALAETPQFNPAFSIADNLAGLKGRTATVHLTSGQTITGVVKEIGDHVLHLEKIAQREFFDAVIRVETISAVEARVR